MSESIEIVDVPELGRFELRVDGVLTPTDLARKMQEIEGRWPAEPQQGDAAAL